MPLLLCHECFFWVESRDGRCPECDHPMDTGIPDPSIDALERIIGPAIAPLGCVRIRRRLLPELGTLYETGNGLFFAPHVVRRRVELVEKTAAGRSFMWMMASVVFAPLILVLPFLRFRNLRAEEVPVYEPVRLPEADRDALGRMLMENPGAFFVSRNAVRRIRRRWGRWRIVRRIGPVLRLSPESDPREFDVQMHDLVRRDTWRQAAQG